jgi:C4-dicarboxylate transporter, DctM subunit
VISIHQFLSRFDKTLTRWELRFSLVILSLLMGCLLFWMALKGIATPTTETLYSGFLFRGTGLAIVFGVVASKIFKRGVVTLASIAFAIGAAWIFRNTATAWAQNILAWIQEGSFFCWLGGMRGLATRLTVTLALCGALMATSTGRHVSIDVLTRLFNAQWQLWLSRITALISAFICFISAVGFVDFISIDTFGAHPTDTKAEKFGAITHGLSLHTEHAFTQIKIDLHVLPRIVGGTPYAKSVSAQEWNEWTSAHTNANVLKELDPVAQRAPLLSPPDISPRGLLLKDLNLVIPIGLLLMAIRFLLWMLIGKPEHHAGNWGSIKTLASLIPISGIAALTSIPAGIVALCALCGLPLFALMAGSTSLLWFLDGSPLNRLAPKVLDESFAGSPVLVTIPLFTLLGFVLAASKAPSRIVTASRAIFGFLPGGMALVCLVASAFFTALSGGSGVTIVAIGGLLYPSLRNQNYSEKFSLGLTTSGGSLGLLFPPSLPILIYALVAGLDFELIFKASFFPGLLVLSILAMYAAFTGAKEKIPKDPFVLSDAISSVGTIKYELLIPVVILGGLASGLASIDESAALALAYTLGVSVWVQRDVKWKQIPHVVQESLRLSGAIILILMMANAFMNYVIDARWPNRVLDVLLNAGLSEKWQFLIVLNLFLLIIGMIMDGISALLVAVPLVIPLAARFGLSPFHLASMVILNLELAFCMPPLGLNLFIASFRFERPVASLFKAVMPFVVLLTVSLGLVVAFPILSTALIQPAIAEKRAQAISLQIPPRDAWALECVQEDALAAHPCSEEEKQQFSVDAGTAEDDLFKEMMEP